jgi:peptidoglycan/LPS O-acetylase OafA/YrhL
LNFAVLGVWFFFVLSGFLITSVLEEDAERQREGTFTRFYIRRAFRIFPLYYLATAIGVLFAIPHFQDKLGWIVAYLVNVAYVVKDDAQLGYAGHFWTLAVEEQFYLVWPVVVILLRRHI